MADERYRLFACVLYPESLPEDFVEIIDSLHVKAFLSPLHDQDLNLDTDEIKKPHYHLFLMFDGKKSVQQVYDMVHEALGVNFVEVIQSCCSYARYLCHLDNGNVPWKRMYAIEDVKSFGGADYLSCILTTQDLKKVQEEMFNYARSNHIDYWWIFVEKAQEHPEWIPFLNKAPGQFLQNYMRSKLAWRRDRYSQNV